MNKIIFINRYFYPDLSATSQMLSDLAFSLVGSYRVSIVTSRQTYENPEAGLPARQNHAEVEIIRVWSTSFGRTSLVGRAFDYASFYLASLWTLLRITRNGDVIIAKTDPPLISVIALIAAKIKGAKLINWLQDVFPEVAVSLGVLTWPPLVGLIRWLRNLSLREAEVNVVLGGRMRECVCAQGVERTKTTIIHNWADGNLIKPVSPASNTLRDAWNLQGKFVVGYSGNMGRAHEFDTIIGAMKYLRNEKNIVFVFVGGGAGKKKLELAVSEHGLNNCLFMPYQPREHLSQSLSTADVHLVTLLPQLEGAIVPSKVYGIAAAGRPLIFIGDPAGEVGRLVEKYKLGFAVPTGADGELTLRIHELEQNPEMTERMGAEARHSFETCFERSFAMEAWESMLVKFISPNQVLNHKK